MTPLSSDLVIASGQAIGLVIPPDAAGLASKMLAELVGSWPDPAPSERRCTVGEDPWGAIALTIEDPAETAIALTGALAGLTLAVKDNIAVAGVPTALGSGLPGFVGETDATVVARARAAGAKITAKAQCEAFLLGANSFTSRPRPVENPHNPARSAGGSSSGSAAMLAAGLADLAIGTDSGGSIRIPASHCGVVGFMPTRGRVPYTGIVPLEPFLERVGPMARSVADVIKLFAVLDGDDGVDVRCAWRIVREERGAISTDNLKLGVSAETYALCDSEVAAAFDQALGRLRTAGTQTSPFNWGGVAKAGELHSAIYIIGDALTHLGSSGAIAASQPAGWAEWRDAIDQEDLPPLTALGYAAGLALHHADPGLQARAIAAGLAFGDALDRALDGIDALMLPVSPSLPHPVPLDLDSASPETLYGDTRLTVPFNVTGHPVISLPAGVVGSLPVGIQLVGRRGHDAHLLAVALAIEAILGPAPTPSPREISR